MGENQALEKTSKKIINLILQFKVFENAIEQLVNELESQDKILSEIGPLFQKSSVETPTPGEVNEFLHDQEGTLLYINRSCVEALECQEEIRTLNKTLSTLSNKFETTLSTENHLNALQRIQD